MDRFIETQILLRGVKVQHLKSNMDRFIELSFLQPFLQVFHLKSNMDRFIARLLQVH